MYVNTNVAALNAWQNLNNTQQSLTGVLQQLSSGNRINSAANDPAGLAISQQMLTQIDGLKQAYTDSQSGISLLQTADGALGQIQNILQSMRSLASEAATSTNNSTDLSNIQTEMNQYAAEITQITNNTQFNNVNLLGGTFSNQLIQVGANENQTLTLSLGAADAYTLGVTGQSSTITGTDSITNGSAINTTGLSAATYTLSTQTTAWSATSYSTSITGTTPTTGAAATAFTTISGTYNGTTADNLVFTVATTAGTSTVTTVTYTDATHTTATSVTVSGSSFTLDGVTFALNSGTSLAAAAGSSTYSVDVTLNPSTTNSYVMDGATTVATLATTLGGNVASGTTLSLTGTNTAVSFDAGTSLSSLSSSTDQYVQYQGLSGASVGSASIVWGGTTGSASSTLLTDSFNVTQIGSAATTYTNGTGNASVDNSAGTATGINVSTQANAEVALTTIDTAINNLSNERANVGAYQNRLQFASTDLQTSQQNLQAARAGITNADMALEMAKLSQEQILQQSGVAMLAQADAMPQALLKLLP